MTIDNFLIHMGMLLVALFFGLILAYAMREAGKSLYMLDEYNKEEIRKR